jgi:hypothetical protein
VELIESFVEGRANAEEFERAYLTLFKNDATMWREPEFGVLDRLFADVDAFCADPELRDAGDLDEGQLRQRSEVALRGLKALQGG